MFYQYLRYVEAAKGYRQVEESRRMPMNSYYGELVQGQAIIRAFGKTADNSRHFENLHKSFTKARATVDAIDVLSAFLLSIFSTLYMSFLFIYYFYYDASGKYVVFIFFNVIRLEEFLLRANDSIMVFFVKLKCLARCE